MDRVTFDRKLLVDDYHDVQLHGFCDASNIGYDAYVYVRSSEKYKNTVTRLLCAKSRVAPGQSVRNLDRMSRVAYFIILGAPRYT